MHAIHRKLLQMLLILLMCTFTKEATAQKGRIINKKDAPDSIHVNAGKAVVYKDSLYFVLNDTVICLEPGSVIKIKDNPYAASKNFYDSLQTRAYKTRITKLLYNWMFRSPFKITEDSIEAENAKAYFLPYSNKIIGNIYVRHVDLVEGSATDTLLKSETIVSKFVNRIHINSKDKNILRNLLFKKGDKVSPTQLAENERVLRGFSYLQDARILISSRAQTRDTVDVIVIVQDHFEYGGRIEYAGRDDYNLMLSNKNFAGTGKEFRAAYYYNRVNSPHSGTVLAYRDPNFINTFCEINLSWYSYHEKSGMELNLNRPFVTTQTKWAGGFSTGFLKQYYDVTENSTLNRKSYDYNYEDGWLGHSFKIQGQEVDKNIIIAGRILNQKFHNTPYLSVDSNYSFHDSRFVLGSITYSTFHYLKSHFVKSFGKTEDIRVGFSAQLIGGHQHTTFRDRPYLAASVSAAEYMSGFGYMYFSSGIGGFRSANDFEEANFNNQAHYFSPLVKMKQIRFRQIVDLNYINGFNRKQIKYVTLEQQMQQIGNISGSERLAINTESVFFMPYVYYGFKIAGFLFGTAGLINTDGTLIQSQNLYTRFGFGLRLYNESLLFKYIELRIGFSPRIAEEGNSFIFDITDLSPMLAPDPLIIPPGALPFQ